MKKSLVEILKQIIPVMIGVYLGFALNNFGEERKMKRQVSSYKDMLVNEILENKLEIKKVNPYHEKIAKDFREILRSDDVVSDFSNYKFMGLQPGMVNSSAYETGIQTGIVQAFELDKIQRINKLYNYQDVYVKFNENMINSFSSKGFPESEADIRNMLRVVSMSMNDINSFEYQLLAEYDSILAVMQ